MPSIANITVKKNDGTTDVTYTGIQPSSGDNTPAIWKSTLIGNAPAHQPEVRLSARDAGKGQSRELRLTAKYPQIATNTTTGVTSVVGSATAACSWVIPKGMASADINEFASQLANIIASTLLKDCVKTGYSAS